MKNYKLSPVVLLLVFLISNFNQTLNAQNQAGMPDATFGTNGLVVTLPPNNAGNLSVKDLALQPDGKIVALGAHTLVTPEISFVRFWLSRYNSDGSLDAGFGAGGVSSSDFGGFARANSLSLQPDGKILVAGEFASRAVGVSDRNDAILARYNADGTLDASFGENGLIIANLAFFEEVSDDRFFSVFALADGKILVAGTKRARHFNYDLYTSSTVLLRYNPDGTPDAGFGSGGKIVSNVLSYAETAVSAALSNDGKLLVSAFSTYKNAQSRSVLFRYNPDGSLDTGFGAGGALIFNSQSAAVTCVLPNQQILIYLPSVLSLYEANGVFDRVVLNPFQMPVGIKSLTLQTDGKIVVFGETFNTAGILLTGVARFHASGQPDTSFGVNGSFIRDSQSWSNAVKVIVQPDGKILTGGGISLPANQSFFVSRYTGSASSAAGLNNTKRGK